MSESFDISALAARMGEAHLAARMRMQVTHAADAFGGGVTFFHIENMPALHAIIRWAFKCTGLYQMGYRNFRDLRVVRNTVEIDDLPNAFDGFRLLHMSDLHMDLDPTYTDVIIDRLQACEYDLCVLTGDYRNRTYGTYEEVVRQCAKLREALTTDVYAILGNHDFAEVVCELEPLGVTFLINESVRIERDGQPLWLVGIDDPVIYMMDNLEKALMGVPARDTTVLLSHAPGVYRVAEAHGIDFMLAGHTHGGQICLPGGIAIITNDACKREMVKGAWSYGDMTGYTSPGTGSCAVPVRFFCPPEITLHTLRKGGRRSVRRIARNE
jgi:predicted MPP superfamily phosphohydrolase